MFVLALMLMRDLGFSPDRDTGPVAEIKKIVNNSVTYGLKVSAIRNTMISGVFAGGVGDVRVLRPAAATCWTCGATRRRTGSPVWWPRSSRAP